MKFFLDHCVPNRVGAMLADAAHEVVWLRDCLPANSTDLIVLMKSEELDAVLISLNGDFADTLPIRLRIIVGLLPCKYAIVRKPLFRLPNGCWRISVSIPSDAKWMESYC